MASKLEKLQEQIAQLQKEAEEVLAQEKAGVVEDIRKKIDLYHITPRELGFMMDTHHRGAGKPAPVIKYRLNEQTWSGRGRKPKWVEDYLTQGGKLEELAA